MGSKAERTRAACFRCQKPSSETDKLVVARDTAICADCVIDCLKLLINEDVVSLGRVIANLTHDLPAIHLESIPDGHFFDALYEALQSHDLARARREQEKAASEIAFIERGLERRRKSRDGVRSPAPMK